MDKVSNLLHLIGSVLLAQKGPTVPQLDWPPLQLADTSRYGEYLVVLPPDSVQRNSNLEPSLYYRALWTGPHYIMSVAYNIYCIYGSDIILTWSFIKVAMCTVFPPGINKTDTEHFMKTKFHEFSLIFPREK